ncbi:MAG: hypothetical protein U5O39_01885 [Gammaproteobacteria bacterium]|nr:hypothetical protein [Gammaproteobacteria bacterium]
MTDALNLMSTTSGQWAVKVCNAIGTFRLTVSQEQQRRHGVDCLVRDSLAV